jgi:hypothetical protein
MIREEYTNVDGIHIKLQCQYTFESMLFKLGPIRLTTIYLLDFKLKIDIYLLDFKNSKKKTL